MFQFNFLILFVIILYYKGIVTLWKGSIGCGVLWALSQIAEIVIADVFNLPKTVVPDGSRQRFWRHVMLKRFLFLVFLIVSIFCFAAIHTFLPRHLSSLLLWKPLGYVSINFLHLSFLPECGFKRDILR